MRIGQTGGKKNPPSSFVAGAGGAGVGTFRVATSPLQRIVSPQARMASPVPMVAQRPLSPPVAGPAKVATQAPSFAFGQLMMPTMPFRQVPPGAPLPMNSPQRPSSPQAMVQFRILALHQRRSTFRQPRTADRGACGAACGAECAVRGPCSRGTCGTCRGGTGACQASDTSTAGAVQMPSLSAPWTSWQTEETVPNMSASARTIVPPQAPTGLLAWLRRSCNLLAFS